MAINATIGGSPKQSINNTDLKARCKNILDQLRSMKQRTPKDNQHQIFRDTFDVLEDITRILQESIQVEKNNG